jgi:hypothetical protein
MKKHYPVQKFIHLSISILFILFFSCAKKKDDSKDIQNLLLLWLIQPKPTSAVEVCKVYPTSYSVSGTNLELLGYASGTTSCNFSKDTLQKVCTGSKPETYTYSSSLDFVEDRPSKDFYYDSNKESVDIQYSYDSQKRKIKTVATYQAGEVAITTFLEWDEKGRPLKSNFSFTGCNLSNTSYRYTNNSEIRTITDNGSGPGCQTGTWEVTTIFDSNQNMLSRTATGIVSGNVIFTQLSTAKVCTEK